jgi:ketosteroid isomerase-like protein
MSQEDVQSVRESFLASASGDPAAAQRVWDPSIELDMSGVAGWPEQRVLRGQTEVAEFFQAWADSWEDWHFDLEEVRDAADEMVFVALHEWGTGAESGANVDQRRYFVVTVREGRGVRVQMFTEAADAREAAGLAA